MSRLDKLKEEIGYLKVLFGILIAIAVSIISWLFQNSDTIANSKILISIAATVVVFCAIIYTNKRILNKIDQLEEL